MSTNLTSFNADAVVYNVSEEIQNLVHRYNDIKRPEREGQDPILFHRTVKVQFRHSNILSDDPALWEGNGVSIRITGDRGLYGYYYSADDDTHHYYVRGDLREWVQQFGDERITDDEWGALTLVGHLVSDGYAYVVSSPDATKIDLPDLTGSPKQIKWAVDIRRRFLTSGDLDDIQYKLTNPQKRENAGLTQYYQTICEQYPDNPVMTIVQQFGLYLVKRKTEAKWWIENRRSLDCSALRLWDAWVTSVIGKEARVRAKRMYALAQLATAQQEQEKAQKKCMRYYPGSPLSAIAPDEGYTEDEVQVVLDAVKVRFPNRPNEVRQPLGPIQYGRRSVDEAELCDAYYSCLYWQDQLDKLDNKQGDQQQ